MVLKKRKHIEMYIFDCPYGLERRYIKYAWKSLDSNTIYYFVNGLNGENHIEMYWFEEWRYRSTMWYTVNDVDLKLVTEMELE